MRGGDVRVVGQVTRPVDGFSGALAFTLRCGEQGDGL